MKSTTKEYWRRKAEKILERVMLKDFPDLNTYKITKFWIDFTEKILTLTSTIILILTFTWYFPKFYGLNNEIAIIVLLCLILMQVSQQNNE